MDEVLDQLGDSKVFTILDVESAFHQVALDESCRHLTAFSTAYEHYQFRTTPFGMQSSPIAFLCTVSTILKEFLNKNVFVYVDDIIIHTADENTNCLLIEKVLKTLHKHNLKWKPQKCSFLQRSVKYLGYVITENGLEIDQFKTKCVKDYTCPKSVVEVQRFLGFVNFYRKKKYIKNLAKIAKPLYDLCKKDVEFVWSIDCEDAFEKLKQALISPPVLAIPNFNLEFILTTDASEYAVGGVLANLDGKDERPIQYFSRSLNPTQTRYSVIERELLAYLFGRKFKVKTDHKPLEYIFDNKHHNKRIHRWCMLLSEYEFEVFYKPGHLNNADADMCG